MEDISTLRAAWIFDAKGNLKQTKNQTDKGKATEIYYRVREALKYTRSVIAEEGFQRLSFVKGKQEWTITVTNEKEIIVMQKDQNSP